MRTTDHAAKYGLTRKQFAFRGMVGCYLMAFILFVIGVRLITSVDSIWQQLIVGVIPALLFVFCVGAGATARRDWRMER